VITRDNEHDNDARDDTAQSESKPPESKDSLPVKPDESVKAPQGERVAFSEDTRPVHTTDDGRGSKGKSDSGSCSGSEEEGGS